MTMPRHEPFAVPALRRKNDCRSEHKITQPRACLVNASQRKNRNDSLDDWISLPGGTRQVEECFDELTGTWYWFLIGLLLWIQFKSEGGFNGRQIVSDMTTVNTIFIDAASNETQDLPYLSLRQTAIVLHCLSRKKAEERGRIVPTGNSDTGRHRGLSRIRLFFSGGGGRRVVSRM